MSNTRQQRRQSQRSGSAPPPKRDPMTFVYLGFAGVVALIVVVLLIVRWQQTREIQAAYATPTPAPTTGKPTPKPIQLVDGTTIGKAVIPVAKDSTDTAKGGQGQDVDGMTCAGMEYATLHVHAHLAIFDHGVQVQVPRLIGGAPKPPQGCLYWLHTHDATGIIHVEAPQLAPPGGSGYTLGNFFDIWGQPLDRNDVAGIKGPVTAYVNGVEYHGELAQIPLVSHQEITLEVGTPLVTPPTYTFPLNE